MSWREVAAVEFDVAYRAGAVELFLAEFGRLRATVPATPGTMADRGTVAARIDHLLDAGGGIAAVREGRLVGYLCWLVLDDFRGTGQRAALCPAWGHAVHGEDPAPVYHALYRRAARLWTEVGCRAHAVTVLAHHHTAVQALFHNGFGLTAIDAVRTIDPGADRTGTTGGGHVLAPGLTVRPATLADLPALVGLESEHRQHYSRPPILMAPLTPPGPDEIRAVLTDPVAGYWLALHAGRPVGFLRCEPTVHGASPIVHADTGIAIGAAFVRAGHRGRGLATGLLDTALAGYADAGFTHCSVDFESFNPEARAFWLCTFTPVCLSLVRHPEAALLPPR